VNGTFHIDVDGGTGSDVVFVDIRNITGTAAPGSSSVEVNAGTGNDLIAYLQDDPTGMVDANLQGGPGNDTLALVLQGGQRPTVQGFQTIQSFPDLRALLAAFPQLSFS
jgi:hypothetical protein